MRLVTRVTASLAFLFTTAACSPAREGSGLGESAERATDVASSIASPSGAAEPLLPERIWKPYDGPTGITCASFNKGAKLPWLARGGDFDPQAVGEAKLAPYWTGTLKLDATALMKADFFVLKSGGTANLSSRESGNGPKLRVRRADGTEVVLAAQADSTINCSTSNAVGGSTGLSLGTYPVLIAFGALPVDAVAATLEVHVAKVYSSGATVRLHRGLTPRSPVRPVEPGIASRYPGDVGIENDPSVLWTSNFDAADWWKKWLLSKSPSDATCKEVTENPLLGFLADSGLAMQAFMPAASYGAGCGLRLGLVSALGAEQNEFRFRYRLKLGKNFRDPIVVEGGKLPGPASQYFDNYTPLCANGGTPSDGLCGWSLRGGFSMLADKNNPAYPRVNLHTYAYHADMVTINPDGTRTVNQSYGDYWAWSRGGGLIELDRWYSIEQYVKVNTPGLRDGIMRVWIDGQLAFEKTNVFLRRPGPYPAEVTGDLGVRQMWVNIFYGGKNPPGTDMTLWIDNFVIAKSYIGPYVAQGAAPTPTPMPTLAPAPAPEPTDALDDSATGATCSYFNKGSLKLWVNKGGDNEPEVLAEAKAAPYWAGVLRLDATSALNADFIMLRSSGVAHVAARESGRGPQLRVRRADGSEVVLNALADTAINCSTTQALGGQTSMSLGPGAVAIAFDDIPSDAVAATLELNVTKVYSSGATVRLHRGLAPIIR